MSNLDDFMPGPKIEYIACNKALSPSKLPGLDYALNPYSGCSHCCTYCYAPDLLKLDWKSWGHVKVKAGIAKALAKELKTKRGVIGLGTVTDPYQVLEETVKNTRSCLDVIISEDMPVSVLTKSDLILRDSELYSKLSRVEIGISISCNDTYSVYFEKNVPLPSRRLKALKELTETGMNTYALIGPAVCGITDKSEDLVQQIADTGVKRVMIDKLNLRSGLSQRMEAVLPGSSADSQKAVNSIKFSCKIAGLKTEDVF